MKLFGIQFRRRVIRVAVRKKTKIERAHYAMHKESARKIIEARISHWNQYYGFSYRRVAIRDTRTRWGSCSSKKNLNFSYKLMFLPSELLDYVVVHELCHLRHMNHSFAFWSCVAETLPDFKKLKKQLQQLQVDIQIM